jgi:tRNA-specific 2-thiouridylase
VKRRLAVVAMSGGVDSSVAAALIAEQGYEVAGVTLKLLPRLETGFGCCGSPADIEDAKRVAERLGIRHYVMDLSVLFEDQVIASFVREYASARTPNPCVECNRSVKFGHLLALARAWGADILATGHYARAEGGKLLRARDEGKDQSYFLYQLRAPELSSVRFPVGELAKEEVRAKARALGLATADKPESQEICFVPNRDYRSFVRTRLEAEESPAAASAGGPIVDRKGRPLGRHAGYLDFTVGQRRGLGLSGGSAASYVVAIRPETSSVVVGPEEILYARSIDVKNLSWCGGGAFPERVWTRIRHRHRPALSRLERVGEDTLRAHFEEPQRAPAPGQAAVFYEGDLVLGGGTIENAVSCVEKKDAGIS